VAVPPLETVAEVEPPVGAPNVKATTPVPERLTVCGLLAALSLRVRDPELSPNADGLKLTAMLHVALTSIPLPQVLVEAKFPLVAIPEIVRGAVPEFVKVTFCVVLIAP
jgi:hypothetical protein